MKVGKYPFHPIIITNLIVNAIVIAIIAYRYLTKQQFTFSFVFLTVSIGLIVLAIYGIKQNVKQKKVDKLEQERLADLYKDKSNIIPFPSHVRKTSSED